MASNRAERRRAEKLAKKQGKANGSASQGAAIDVYMEQASEHYQAGRLLETLKLLEKIIAADPTRHNVAATAGLIAFDLGKFEKAAQHYQLAIKLEPNDIKAQFALGISLKSLGRFEEAADPLRKAASLSNGAVEPVKALVEVLWQIGGSVEIPKLCESLIRQEPHKTLHYMNMALAHYHRGTPDKARELLGFDDLVEIHDLEAPEGYESMETFNKALADFVADDPTTKVPDKTDPKYHNDDLHISRNLTGPDAGEVQGPIRDLEKLIEEKVEDYYERKSESIDHIFIKNWPKDANLVSWGTLLKGQGNLAAHIHIDGYLGMVYYPQLPSEMRSQAADTAEDTSGYLELGRPQEDFPAEVETDIHLIQPKEGRLIMFPGYFFHRTIPFQSKDRRISIAFDVVAKT